ncbi:MAG: CapA family protein [Ilumatobacteraceae bacterium]
MTAGVRRLVLLGAVCVIAVVVAALGWLSPERDEAIGSAPNARPAPTGSAVATPEAFDPSTASSAPLDDATTAENTSGAPTSAAPTTSTLPPTTTQPATTVAPVGQRSLSVVLTGDILTENPVITAGEAGAAGTGARFDFTPVFAPITPFVQSFDLAICQMEIPIGRPGESFGGIGRSPYGGNLIVAPYEMGPAIKATGFDRCTTASNHSYDVGDAGIDSTIDALEQLGISWSGTARRPEEAVPTTFEARGIRLAHLHSKKRSNTDLHADEWRMNHTTDPDRVAADVVAVRQAGAELVIVSIHLFKEMTEQPIAENRDFAAAVTASADIDALVHHGPHVVQGFEVLNDTPVWWSIGNLLSGMARPGQTGRYSDPRSRDGLAAVLRFQEDGPGNWQLATSSVILCNEESSRIVYPGVAAAQDPALDPALREQLQGCVDRTRDAIPDAQ